MHRFRNTILLAALLLLLPLSALALDFSVSHSGVIVGNGVNELTWDAGEAGRVELLLKDANGTLWRRWSFDAEAGRGSLVWDGLGTNGQILSRGDYTLSGTLTAASGEERRTADFVTVGETLQAIRFALPSSDIVYLGESEKFFIEFCLVRAGSVEISLYRADEPDRMLRHWQLTGGSGVPFRWHWDATAQGRKVEPGSYLLRCSLRGDSRKVYEFTVDAVDTDAPSYEPAPTGPLLPADGMSDEEIWALMMEPSFVVDIASVSHRIIRALPTEDSANLGTIHGQTQAVEILDITGLWAHVRVYTHEAGNLTEGYVPLSCLKTAVPNPKYGLLVDKRTQTMVVFEEGKRIAELPVSTGLATAKKPFRETPAGAYLTEYHMEEYSSEGQTFEYPIRYDGGNLLHSIGYKRVNRLRAYSEHEALLGHKASNACVRIPAEADESMIDAAWFWMHLPYHTRVMVLDDSGYARAVATGTDVLWTPSTPTDLAPGEHELVLTFGGDAAIGVRENWWHREDSLAGYLERNGMAYPFSGLQSVFGTDDMTFVNLECVLQRGKNGERTDKMFRFRGLPSWTQVLTDGSVEQVNIANNHYIDYQASGKRSTRVALTDAGIPFSGYTYTYIWEKDGVKVGFAGVRETMYLRDRGIIGREVAALREAGCDVVIYSCHWGVEYSALHNDTQLEMAQAAANAGADIVVGTHPHVVQGIDHIGDTVVLWSLGNLMFGGTIDMATYDAMLVRASLRFGEDGYLGCTIEPIPILTSSQSAAGVNDYRPVVAAGADRERILEKVQTDSSITVTDLMWFGK